MLRLNNLASIHVLDFFFFFVSPFLPKNKNVLHIKQASIQAKKKSKDKPGINLFGVSFEKKSNLEASKVTIALSYS